MAQQKIVNIGAYTQGSAARQLEPVPSRLPRDPHRRPKQKLVTRQKRSYFRPLAALAAVVLAVMAVISLSELASVGNTNAGLREQLEAVDTELNALHSQLDEIITPESIEIYAKGHRMVRPGRGQIVMITVPTE